MCVCVCVCEREREMYICIKIMHCISLISNSCITIHYSVKKDELSHQQNVMHVKWCILVLHIHYLLKMVVSYLTQLFSFLYFGFLADIVIYCFIFSEIVYISELGHCLIICKSQSLFLLPEYP
jgi:hypothetical protein